MKLVKRFSVWNDRHAFSHAQWTRSADHMDVSLMTNQRVPTYGPDVSYDNHADRLKSALATRSSNRSLYAFNNTFQATPHSRRIRQRISILVEVYPILLQLMKVRVLHSPDRIPPVFTDGWIINHYVHFLAMVPRLCICRMSRLDNVQQSRALPTELTLVSIPRDPHSIVDDHQFNLDRKFQRSNTAQCQWSTYMAIPFLCRCVDRLDLVFSCGEFIVVGRQCAI